MLPQLRYLTQHTERGILVLTFTGPLPHADAMGEAVAAVSSAGCDKVVLSFQPVRYLAGDSLGHLVRLWRKVKDARGRLVLADLHPQIGEIMNITRLDELFELRADVAAAVDILTADPAWLLWDGGTVVKLARSIRHEQAFDRLPILADALEEAGCPDTDMLAHCRQPGPHRTRVCWVTSLLTEHC